MNDEKKAAAPVDPPADRWLSSVAAAGLVAAVAWIYWPVVGYDFVNFDDHAYIVDNPHVRGGLTAANAIWALTARQASNWR